MYGQHYMKPSDSSEQLESSLTADGGLIFPMSSLRAGCACFEKAVDIQNSRKGRKMKCNYHGKEDRMEMSMPSSRYLVGQVPMKSMPFGPQYYGETYTLILETFPLLIFAKLVGVMYKTFASKWECFMDQSVTRVAWGFLTTIYRDTIYTLRL